MSSARSYHISMVTCLPYMTPLTPARPNWSPLAHTTRSQLMRTLRQAPTQLFSHTQRKGSFKKKNKKNRTTRVKRRDHTMLVISLYKWSGACTSRLTRLDHGSASASPIQNVSASLITMTLDYSCLIYFNVLITHKAVMTVTVTSDTAADITVTLDGTRFIIS